MSEDTTSGYASETDKRAAIAGTAMEQPVDQRPEPEPPDDGTAPEPPPEPLSQDELDRLATLRRPGRQNSEAEAAELAALAAREHIQPPPAPKEPLPPETAQMHLLTILDQIAGAILHLSGQPGNFGLGRIAADIRERLHLLRPPVEAAPEPDESPPLSDDEKARLAELRAMEPSALTPQQRQEMGTLENREFDPEAPQHPLDPS